MRKSDHHMLLNISSYAVLQFINVLVSLLLPRMYLGVYGSEINGVVSTVNSFTSYFLYLEAGFGIALTRALYKPYVDKNIDQINSLVSFAKREYRKISGIYFILIVILASLFPLFGSAENLGTIEIALLVLVIGSYGALDFYSLAKYRILLTADEKEYIISSASIVSQFIRFVVTWAILPLSISVVWVKTIPILTIFIRSFILRLYIKKRYVYVNFSFSGIPEKKNIKRARSNALLLQISVNISLSFPVILVSHVLGYVEANVYAIYNMIISTVISIVSSLSSGFSAYFGKKISRGDDILTEYEMYECIVSLIVAVIFSVTAMMCVPFVRMYTNIVADVNYVRPYYAVLFSVWAAMHVCRIPMTAIINAAGLYAENKKTNILNLMLQVIGSIVSVVFVGVEGLLVMMIFVTVFRNICFGLNNSKYYLHNRIYNMLVHHIVVILVIVMSYIVSAFFMKDIDFTISSWIIVSGIACILELLLCISLFFIVDRNSTQNIYMLIKRTIKSYF